jgi:hypothetical protein
MVFSRVILRHCERILNIFRLYINVMKILCLWYGVLNKYAFLTLQMWCPQRQTFLFRNFKTVSYAFYSRRSDSKSADSYKPVKPRKSVDGNNESVWSLT